MRLAAAPSNSDAAGGADRVWPDTEGAVPSGVEGEAAADSPSKRPR